MVHLELRPGEKLVPRRVGQELTIGDASVRVLGTAGDRTWLAITPPEGECVRKLEEEELALMASDA